MNIAKFNKTASVFLLFVKNVFIIDHVLIAFKVNMCITLAIVQSSALLLKNLPRLCQKVGEESLEGT